jgi:hypothetical protein
MVLRFQPPSFARFGVTREILGIFMNIRQTLTVAASALIAFTLAAASGAQADTLITYQFDPGTSVDFGSGNTYDATGTFVFDATTGMVTTVDYTAIQTGTGPAGPFVFTSATTISPADVQFTGDGFADVNEFLFANSLALGGTDTITGFIYGFDGGSTPETVTGAVSAVPEPAIWALMLAGFAGLGAALRTRRGKFAAA